VPTCMEKEGILAPRAGHEGKRDVHKVPGGRCASFPSAKRVLIDPGAQTEEERGPGEDPVQHAVVSDGLVIGYFR